MSYSTRFVKKMIVHQVHLFYEIFVLEKLGRIYFYTKKCYGEIVIDFFW
jgi:hypothetical protein